MNEDPHGVDLVRRHLLKAGLVGAGLTVVGGGAMAADVYRFGVSRHPLPLPGLRRPLRLVQLSDLHFGPYLRAGSVDAWVDAALREKPDLLVLTGDFVDILLSEPLDALLTSLQRLRAPLGVYGVWGNHDRRRFPDIGVLRDGLEASGIEMLVNRGRPVRDDLFLAGVDDVRTGRPDLRAALRASPAGAPTILLSHNPDLLPEVAADDADLVLCGHTHGGQVRLPLIGALVTSSRYGQRYAEGWVPAATHAYVSRGLGVSLLPLRLDCPAELVVMELEPA